VRDITDRFCVGDIFDRFVWVTCFWCGGRLRFDRFGVMAISDRLGVGSSLAYFCRFGVGD